MPSQPSGHAKHTHARASERTPYSLHILYYARPAATLIASRPVIALLLLLYILFCVYYAQWRIYVRKKKTKFGSRKPYMYDYLIPNYLFTNWDRYENTPIVNRSSNKNVLQVVLKVHFNFFFLTMTYRYYSIQFSLQA